MKKSMFDTLLEMVRGIVVQASDRDAVLQAVCAALADAVPHYDWVGFYLVDSAHARELVLGPFVGDPTEHTRIAFGQGICGQAAQTEMTFLIQDVSKESNYLACSPSVQSEIVVPIFKDGDVVGELDIDSHQLSPFTEADQSFLEQVAECVVILL